MRLVFRGVTAALLSVLAAFSSVHGQKLAITMDDLPVHGGMAPGETRQDIARRVLAAFREAKVPEVYGFVNGVHAERDPATAEVLQMWRDAGYPLGNHTWSHRNLNEMTAEEFEAEVAKNEPVLQKYMGAKDWHWLRYPFLAEGNTPEKRDDVRAWLAGHGYRIADVTMSFGDYAFNDPYARCRAKGDVASSTKLEEMYLAQARSTAEAVRATSKAALGREVPLVLLMHIGTLDAQALPRLLRMYREMGFEFVSLEEAERDSFYASDLDPKLPRGPSLQAVAAAKHVAVPVVPALPSELAAMCR